MSSLLDSVDSASLRTDLPAFRPGDTVNVHVRVIEGNRSRVQQFKGVVVRRQGAGVRETFTVRKQSFGVGVERTFPVHSPKIEKIEVGAIGDVNRAKLYYLRGKVGKKARVRELRQAPGAKVTSAKVISAKATQGPPPVVIEEATVATEREQIEVPPEASGENVAAEPAADEAVADDTKTTA